MRWLATQKTLHSSGLSVSRRLVLGKNTPYPWGFSCDHLGIYMEICGIWESVMYIYIYTYTQVRWNIDRIIGSSPPSWDRFISKKEGMTIAGLFWVLWSLCFHSWGYADSAFHAAWVKNIGQLVLCYSPRKLRLSPWKRKNTAIWQNFERIVFKAIIFFQGNDIFSFSQEVNQQIQSTSLVTSAGGRLLHLWHLLLL